MEKKLQQRANVNEQTKVVVVEQQIFGEDDPSDEICQVAAGMCRLRTDGQQEQIRTDGNWSKVDNR